MGVAAPDSGLVDRLPSWVSLVRAPNPGPMTLDGTNTWILRPPGRQPAVIVDPGPDDDAHLAAVVAHAPVAFVLVTHGHHDHVGGAGRLAKLLGDVPVRAVDPAHCSNGAPLDRTGTLRVGDLEITVLDTPGHTGDSVCFRAGVGDSAATVPGDGPAGDGERVILTGDTLLGRGTTVVAHPDGDLGQYLTSLRRLAAYRDVMLPGHGPPRADCGEVARAYLDHRLARLDQVRAAVAAGATTAEQVLARVYPDVDEAVRFAALWSVRAQLDHLRRDSSADRRTDWAAVDRAGTDRARIERVRTDRPKVDRP
ncbi:MAG TPA: MBL fold metallo-hydrolase [Actinoplanes sp.]|nr:MBL fold metallo-hydrolase [Actinoplanes sp.]